MQRLQTCDSMEYEVGDDVATIEDPGPTTTQEHGNPISPPDSNDSNGASLWSHINWHSAMSENHEQAPGETGPDRSGHDSRSGSWNCQRDDPDDRASASLAEGEKKEVGSLGVSGFNPNTISTPKVGNIEPEGLKRLSESSAEVYRTNLLGEAQILPLPGTSTSKSEHPKKPSRKLGEQDSHQGRTARL